MAGDDEVSTDALVVVTAEGGLIDYADRAAAEGEARLTFKQAILAMTPGAMASLNIGLQPILFGALVDAGHISQAQLGRVATVELFALAAGSLLAPRVLKFGRVRTVTIALAIALALVNIATFWAVTPAPIYILKALAGLLAGGLTGVTVFLVTRSNRPEQMTSVSQAVSTVPQMVGNYLLATVLNPIFGPYSGFGLMAVLALGVALTAVIGVKAMTPKALDHSSVRPSRALGLALLLALLAILTENAAIGAVWEYLGQVGHLAGLSNQIAASAVSGLLGFQLLGAMAAAWVGWRLDNRTMLILVCLFCAVNGFLICLMRDAAPYVAAACIFGFVQILLYPYGVKLLIELDASRQAAMLLTPLSIVGTGLGPFVCSWFVHPHDVSPAYVLALIGMLITAGLYGAVYLIAPRPLRWLSAMTDAERATGSLH